MGLVAIGLVLWLSAGALLRRWLVDSLVEWDLTIEKLDRPIGRGESRR